MAETDSQNGEMTRRRFVRDAGIATVAVADALNPALAKARKRHRRHGPSRPTVAVFGGGISGLTAAHELAERGFDVTVYERRAWGGKARSTNVPHTASGGRKPLPGEHGWRTWLGFYQNTVDTMRRIPFPGNANGVFDNLAGAPVGTFARAGGHRNLQVPLGVVGPRDLTPAQVVDNIVLAALGLRVSPEAAAHFARRLVVFFSSCDARRIGQWENTNWREFTGVKYDSADPIAVLVYGVSEYAQASKTERTSAEFGGHFVELFAYNLLGRGSNGDFFRFMNRPTNEALFAPWLHVLDSLGVRRLLGYELTGLRMHRGRLAGATVRRGHHSFTVHADWYVCAIPVERARRLWTKEILTADPHLGQMRNLETAWENGMKFFLREPVPIGRGPVAYGDSPWLITSVSQAQFWPLDFASTYGDGSVRESLSAIVSNWTTPGVLYGKPANECTPQQVANEVWEQMKRHLNDTGDQTLRDDMLVSWNIDPGMIRSRGRLISDDPLVLPAVGQYQDRPEVATAIPNLLLAGDYLKSNWEVANMETASYNGRRCANAVLERSGSRETPTAAIKSYTPPEWEPFKRIDEDRYRRGQPNLFDADLTAAQVRDLLGQTGGVLTGAGGRLGTSA